MSLDGQFPHRFLATLRPKLRSPWLWLQLFCGLLPFSPVLAGLSFAVVMEQVLSQQAGAIAQRPRNRALAALSAWLVIMALGANDRGNALLGLTNFLPFFLFFAVTREVVQSVAHLRRIAWILVISACPVILIGLGQMYGGWAGHVRIGAVLIDWPIAPTGNPPGRMASIFTYANVLASYLVVTLTLTVGLWVETRTVLRHGPRSVPPPIPPADPQASQSPIVSLERSPVLTVPLVWQMGFLTLVLGAHAIAILLANSRNAWGISAIVGLAFAVYCRWYGVIWLGLVSLASVFWAAFGPFGQSGLRAIVPAFLWARLTDQNYPDRPVASLRLSQWQFASTLIQERPWTGWGLRSFSPLYETATGYWLGHPHNLFLMLAAETGIPATLGLMGIVATILYGGVRQWQVCQHQGDRATALVLFTYGIAFGACLLFHLFDVPLFDARINVLGWLLLAGIAGLQANGTGDDDGG